MIDRYLKGKELRQPVEPSLPKIYVEPWMLTEEEQADQSRTKIPKVAASDRKKSLVEVEMTLSKADATRESRRCLRCDLDFTKQSVEIKETEKTLQ
jgi:hypothetical protein